MGIAIVPYTAEHEAGVRAFNARLGAANPDPNLYSVHFPESHVPQWLPKRDGCGLYQEFFVAVDEGGVVRGGYFLKHQPCLVKGECLDLATYQLPISEGIIDPTFAIVGVSLYRDAAKRHPLLWGLGGGGLQSPIGRFLVAAGWRTLLVPFWFRVVNPNAFLRNASLLKRSFLRRAGTELLRCSGLGWLGLKGLLALRRCHRPSKGVRYESVSDFAPWADEVWERCRQDFSLVAVRDAQALNTLYPADNPRFLRLKVTRMGSTIGWAVVLNTPMMGHKHFGNMRVGTLVDCLAKAEDAAEVVACAREALEAGGVDLILSNQAHHAWCRALKACGFSEGPSNFPLFLAPKLAERLQPLDLHAATFHMNRGDGDGPINL